MTYTALKRTVYALGLVAIAGACSGRILQFGFGQVVFGSWAGQVASIASMSPLAVYAGFVLLSGWPSGRRIVPIPGTQGQDTALFMLMLCGFTPSSAIRDLVPRGWPSASPAQSVLMVFALVSCIIWRVIQLSMGARIGVTLSDGSSPDGQR